MASTHSDTALPGAHVNDLELELFASKEDFKFSAAHFVAHDVSARRHSNTAMASARSTGLNLAWAALPPPASAGAALEVWRGRERLNGGRLPQCVAVRNAACALPSS
jgi:hypothetical protein